MLASTLPSVSRLDGKMPSIRAENCPKSMPEIWKRTKNVVTLHLSIRRQARNQNERHKAGHGHPMQLAARESNTIKNTRDYGKDFV